MTLILQDETFDMKNYGNTNLKQKEKWSDKQNLRFFYFFQTEFYKYFNKITILNFGII